MSCCDVYFIFVSILLLQAVAAWEEQGENRRIAAMDGDGAVPDNMVAGLVREMTGEQVLPPPMGEFVALQYAVQ